MSVITSRALPDLRDGLKPVHRRILYSMYESGFFYNKQHRKSARTVGDVIGKYHPHGDTAVYDALVRMAQDFSLRIPLVNGQGNFGSIDGDSAAAMRYTEARLSKISHSLLEDIDKNTVDFRPNYDNSEEEPKVLPAAFPNILVNGASGIAVGMATNIPPHNLSEVLNACCAYIDNNDILIDELMDYIKGPDFPTSGSILGSSTIKTAYSTGKGIITVRGKAEIEDYDKNKKAIIITEIPYGINKVRIVERIVELVNNKTIIGVSDIRDESDKTGIRVAVELKKDSHPEVVLNQIYKFTPLQSSFGINMIALDNGIPKILTLKEIIAGFVNFRKEIVTRRTEYLLEQARNKAHLLLGVHVAVANIDEVISIIRKSKDPAEAKHELLSRTWKVDNITQWIALVDNVPVDAISNVYHLTERQAKSILEMKLQRLTAMEKDKIVENIQELLNNISKYLKILNSQAELLLVIKEELNALHEYSTPRLTVIEEDFEVEDENSLIPKEDMIVTVTLNGYIKRLPLTTYRTQHRGGKGKSGLSMNESDVITQIFIASTHSEVLFFSTHGRVYSLKLYKLPLGSTQSKGRPIVNLLQLNKNEKINNILALPDIHGSSNVSLRDQEEQKQLTLDTNELSKIPYINNVLSEEDFDNLNIIFSTKHGNVRRNKLSDFINIRTNGKIAIKLKDNDELISVQTCSDDDHILLATKQGKAIRFPIDAIRVFKGRASDGVRGIKLTTDVVVGMTILNGIEFDSDTKEKYLGIPIDKRIEIKEKALHSPENLPNMEKFELKPDQIVQFAKSEQFILSITSNGYGKRSSAYEYRITNRGGSGIINISSSKKIGHLVATLSVDTDDQIVLITDQGQVIRCKVSDIRSTGRNTSGVILFKLNENEYVVSAAVVEDTDTENI